MYLGLFQIPGKSRLNQQLSLPKLEERGRRVSPAEGIGIGETKVGKVIIVVSGR